MEKERCQIFYTSVLMKCGRITPSVSIRSRDTGPYEDGRNSKEMAIKDTSRTYLKVVLSPDSIAELLLVTSFVGNMISDYRC